VKLWVHLAARGVSIGACGPKKAEMLNDRKKEKTYAESKAIKIAAV
jgi:hypothetical protein